MSLNCGLTNRKHTYSRVDYMDFIGSNTPVVSHEHIAHMHNLYDLISIEEIYSHIVIVKSQEINYTDDIEYNKLLDIIELRDAISNKIIKLNISLKKQKHLENATKRKLEIIIEPANTRLSQNTSMSSMHSNTPRNVHLMFE